MKKNSFKVGDKVFAKVKGYPPWPAHVIAENGKKYNVEFFGTGETGVIKVEDLFYYLKNKDKFQKPLKRKDYVDAFKQIEEAIKEDGGDGDTSVDDENTASPENNETNSSLNTSTQGIKKSIKRKRSVSEKSNSEAVSSKKKPQKIEEDLSKTDQSEPPKVPITKFPVKEEPTEQASKEIEFIPVDDNVEKTMEDIEKKAMEDNEINEKPNVKETSEILDLKIEIVSEKCLKNDIVYANYVKEKESIYKGKPVEPREDYISQVLPVKLPSGLMGGIKLHTEWPLKFEFEYDRALYDESVALRVLEEKRKIESGNTSIITTNPQQFIANIDMSADDVTEILYQKDIETKKSRIDRLKLESELMGFDSKIKNCLGLDKADPKQAIGYLDSIYKINFDDLMLIKHPHVVEMVRRLRKYVGNTKEWNLSEESLNEFSAHAEKVRAKAEHVYTKFKKVVKIPSASFWEGFMDLVSQFRTDCKELTEGQIYLLCAEPTSRRTFLNNLEEVESEKENSSGVANSEQEIVKGGSETPAAESC